MYFPERIRDADYTDDLVLLTYSPTLAECLLSASSWTQLKTEFMCFKQDVAIFLNDQHLKLVDHFTFLGSIISSTESDFNILIKKGIDYYWLVTDHFEI